MKVMSRNMLNVCSLGEQYIQLIQKRLSFANFKLLSVQSTGEKSEIHTTKFAIAPLNP